MTEVSDRNQKTWHSWLAAHSYRKADGLFPAEERILGRLGPTLQSARLLDVGIGTGRTTASLAGRVKQYVGVDYSPTMLTLARSRFPHADLRLADARKLTEDFGQAQFDLVLFSFNGIDGVDHDDRLRILDGIRQVLVPDGILIFSTHNRAEPRTSAFSRANLDIGWSPYKFARGLTLYALGIANRAVNMPHERETVEYAIVNDPAGNYALLQYYIHWQDQIAQLRRAGFRDIEAFDLDGEAVLDRDRAARAGYMIHFVARNT